MFEKVNFGSGKIVFNDCDISFNKSLKKQLDLLKEDLFQVAYAEGYSIDAGWYPSFDERGSFMIVVISNYDWDKPLHMRKCNDLKVLTLHMRECVAIVKELISNGN